ncbi:thiol reductant ABC exporter subunit CydC [Svornostia abyssi]|uniref:Thiol reductant ABC exporter subunit CydC n=1 Tax=Svornostia abyssi TaxID=2898438 RepID=A0ABY5PJC7_9ACTN|nr:thiol reductant ABC exporter subunit CydC [Parviterribacteraceae bacterium J379]
MRNDTLRRLLDLADAPRKRLALAITLGALAVCFGIGLMATSGYLISRAAEQPPVLSLTIAIVFVRAFGVARPIARYLERITSHDVAFRTLGTLRSKLYTRIEPLAPAGLASFRRGDLLSRMVADVDALQDLYLRGLLPPFVALAAGVVAVVAAALFLPLAAAILAVGLLVQGVAVPALAGRLNRTAGRRQAAARAALSAELVETLRAAPELVAFGAAAEREERIAAADRDLDRVARRDAWVAGLGDALGVLVTGVTVAAVTAVAVAAHDATTLDRVLIAMLALLAMAAFEGTQPLAEAARRLSGVVAAGRRVLELTDREPAVRDPDDPLPAPPRDAELVFTDVRARYAPDEPLALDGLDLRLAPGRKVALRGPSGSGKTTAVNLLLRFMDPERGRITLAGADLRDFTQADVRRHIAVCGQDAHLFNSNIRENIRLARPSATDDELRAAVDRAGLGDWVDTLPDGLDTMVGEEGAELSGGQRQRIALARALLADAPVLVLDEPTAHLDEETAHRVIDDAFDAAAADDRAVLLITHRGEGLARCDEVVQLA